MDIDLLDESDLPALPALQPPGWRGLVPSLTTYLVEPYCRPVKAVINGAVAGVGAGILLGSSGWLAHIIVHQNYRRRGIGRALVDHLTEWLHGVGCATVSLIATQLGHSVYAKAGYCEQTEYLVFQREDPAALLAWPPLPGALPHLAKLFSRPAALKPVLYQEAHRQGILDLDRDVSGEERANLFRGKLGSSLVCHRDGAVIGFYAPDVGEGLIVAREPEVGLLLVRRRLETANRAVLPIDNTDAVGAMRTAGMADAGRAFRMVLGKSFLWKPECIYIRIAGNLG